MTTKAQLGTGNVEIDLGDETIILRPTLNAAQQLSRRSGGIISAIRNVGDMDLDTVVLVVSLGANITDKKALRDLPEKIYGAGMAELVGPITKYLSHLANGGRPPKTDADGEGEGEGE